jgi:hypothetical protein
LNWPFIYASSKENDLLKNFSKEMDGPFAAKFKRFVFTINVSGFYSFYFDKMQELLIGNI